MSSAAIPYLDDYLRDKRKRSGNDYPEKQIKREKIQKKKRSHSVSSASSSSEEGEVKEKKRIKVKKEKSKKKQKKKSKDTSSSSSSSSDSSSSTSSSSSSSGSSDSESSDNEVENKRKVKMKIKKQGKKQTVEDTVAAVLQPLKKSGRIEVREKRSATPEKRSKQKSRDRSEERAKKRKHSPTPERRRRSRDRSIEYDRYARRSRSPYERRRRDRSYSPRDQDSRSYYSYYDVERKNRIPEREERYSNNRRDRSRSPRRDYRSRYDRKEGDKSDKPEDESAKPKKKFDILTSRTGGAYIPPARLKMMQSQITDKSSEAYQRISWEALKKSIHGFINKVNVDNIGIITRELLRENIVRGRGLLCKSIIQSQVASPTFTHVYAALVAIINSKFPTIGELLLKRLIIQFRRGFKRNDKTICVTASKFIAHLVNQRVAHEILALEILTLLIQTPTNDSVEVAIAFLKECGQKLTEVTGKGVNSIFELLKNILHEGKLEQRVQYMIEVIFQVRKDGFKDHVPIIEALELVEEDDQFTHLIALDEATGGEDLLNVFKVDPQYLENEEKYKELSKELLGSESEDGSDSGGSGSDDSSGSESEEEKNEENETEKQTIIDNTETNLIALRRTIYLTIHSSLDFEECAHKLLRMELKPGQEVELCHMFLDCCAEQRTYEKFYGLLAQRFCTINRIYTEKFEEIFKDTYDTTHRLDTNRLRNVGKFFGHLLHSDSIGWNVFECVLLNENDTTSSSRVFLKVLFNELAEYMGIKKLNDRLRDTTLLEYFAGLMPRDNPQNTRFSINFFTSIGLGAVTDDMRAHLELLKKN